MQVGWNCRATGRTAQRRTKNLMIFTSQPCALTVRITKPAGSLPRSDKYARQKKLQWFRSKLLEHVIGANASFFGSSTWDEGDLCELSGAVVWTQHARITQRARKFAIFEAQPVPSSFRSQSRRDCKSTSNTGPAGLIIQFVRIS